jgi:hypothetical protein
MENRITPSLVAQAAERQQKRKEIERVQKQSVEVAGRITDIVVAAVPNPDKDLYVHHTGKAIILRFPFQVDEEEVCVEIRAPRYPQYREHPPRYEVHVQNGPLIFVNEDSISSSGKGDGTVTLGFDKKDLDELTELLDVIEYGLKDRTIVPTVVNPHPQSLNGVLLTH